LFVVLGRLLQLAALRFCSEKFKELEIVVLRHELAVLGRQAGRPELKPADRVFLLGVKTQVVSWGTTICRQNADLETPQTTPRRHPERTLASGRGLLEIEARDWQYPNRLVGSTGWVRQVHNPQPCYRVSVSAPRGVSVFVGGRGFLKAHA
jgi:hypothetical protein